MFTDIGRNIYAVGGNATAARLAGIPLNRYTVGCYMLVGLVAGLGGVALHGGRSTIVRTILAVILLGVLENGLIILTVNSFWQDIAQGALLVIAVVIQQRRANSQGVGLP